MVKLQLFSLLGYHTETSEMSQLVKNVRSFNTNYRQFNFPTAL